MIRLIQRRLIIPRGDTGSFSIPILAGKNTGDVAVFTVFDLMTQKKLLEKTVTATNDTLTIEFNHNDTVNLPVGQFVWDIKYYVNPVFADGKLVDGEEIDSYYAAFTLPVCEIRQTGDMMLMVNDAALPPDQLDILLATLNATIAAKNEAVTSAAEADTSATNAENSASAALVSQQAALDSQTAALASQQAAAASAQQALAGAELATIKAEQIATDISNKADRSEIPTKVSDLTDDSGHYTKPANGIPASDLEETYLTQHQDLSNYVQNTDYATTDNAGVVRIDTHYGLSMYGSYITTDPATANNIKKGVNTWKPIAPENEHSAAFYGLAKAAGSDEKDSELPVGQYTNAAKAAIQQMLDVPSTADIPTVPTNVSAFTNDAGYLTQHQDISGKANSADLATVATSGDYDDLINKPTIPEVPVQDVQINGSSILNNGVANIQPAINSQLGVVRINSNLGISIVDNQAALGQIQISPANSQLIKNPAGDTIPQSIQAMYKPITPYKQHESAFYGLAKAAGDTTQSQSNNVIGTYTDGAKAAIQQMLGVPAASEIPTKVSQLQNDSGYLTSFTETDPTVSEWAKAATKPSYTAAEVGAPTVQEMNTAIGNAIGNINSFDMAVVQELPTQDISTHTIYLVPKTGETNDVYDEYVYINNAWEMVGNTQIDLSNYVQKTDYATASDAGIVKVSYGPVSGLMLDSNKTLKIYRANSRLIKSGTDSWSVIVPASQHDVTFYGLAKAAGDTTQSQSDNEVGTYTTEAKAAIRSMIGAAASADVTVQDVQVNGQSITTNGVANVALGSGLTSMANPLTNIQTLVVQSANSTRIKNGTELFFPIAPARQHESAFYGLAKAAGDITQSQSENAVGTYTAEAKAAILNMLGAAANSDIPDTSIYATKADTVLETSLSRGRKADTTIGNGSFAFGYNVEASGNYSYATGQNTIASGMRSYAEGLYTLASGGNSHAIGTSTIANGSGMFSMGRYNVGTITYPNWISGASYSPGDRVSYAGWGFLCINANNDTTIGNNWKNIGMNTQMVMAVGNGTADDARSNAYALDWDGNGHYMGNIYVGANADSTGGTKVLCEADFATAQDIQNIINGGAGA